VAQTSINIPSSSVLHGGNSAKASHDPSKYSSRPASPPLVAADPGPSHGAESRLGLGSHQQQISTPDAKLPESTQQDPRLPFGDTSINEPINDPAGKTPLGNDAESSSNVPISNKEPADIHDSPPSNDAISMEDSPSGDNSSPGNGPISNQGPPNIHDRPVGHALSSNDEPPADDKLPKNESNGPDLADQVLPFIVKGFTALLPSSIGKASKFGTEAGRLDIINSRISLKDIIGGQTLSSGVSAVMSPHDPMAFPTSGAFDLGGDSNTLAPLMPALVYAVYAQTFTERDPSAILVDGTTISRGGSGVTIAETPVSLRASGVLVFGSSTVSIPSTFVSQGLEEAPSSVFTVGGQIVAASPTDISIDGTTIVPDYQVELG